MALHPPPDPAVDPRIRRTRQLLHRAFFALLEEKSFESLSVQEITERATVNRATFYNHFDGKIALFEDIIGTGFQSSLRAFFPDENTYGEEVLSRLIQAVCVYIGKLPSPEECPNQDKLLNLLTEAKIKTMLYDFLLGWLSGLKDYQDPGSRERAATMLSSAVYTVAVTWKGEPIRPPPETYAETMMPWVGDGKR